MAAQQRLQRYVDFDQMEYTPEIASSLDIYADEMTTHSKLQPLLSVDCPNEEIDRVEELVENILSPSSTKNRFHLYYNINMDVPLPIDTKTGSNWLNMS